MELPTSRQAVHGHDKSVAWAHPPFGKQEVHNHVIPESRSTQEKSALGDHIDRFHTPLDVLLHQQRPEV